MTDDFDKKIESLRQTLENLQFQYNRALRLRVSEEAEFAKEVDSPEIQDLDVVKKALDLRRLADDEKLILLEKIDVLEKFFTEQIEIFREGMVWKEKSELLETYEFLGSKEKEVREITARVDDIIAGHLGKLRELWSKDKKEYAAYKEGILEVLKETFGKLPAVSFYFKIRTQYLETSFGETIKEEPKETVKEEMLLDEEPQEIHVLSTTPKKFKKKDVKEYFGEAQFKGQSVKAFKLFLKCPGCGQKQTVTDIHNRCWNCNDFLHLKPLDTKEDRDNDHYNTG